MSIGTDDLYAYFVEANRPITQRELAEHFRVGRDLVNRLLRKMVEREQRIRYVRTGSCKFEYHLKGEPVPVTNHFIGWGNAPRLGLK